MQQQPGVQYDPQTPPGAPQYQQPQYPQSPQSPQFQQPYQQNQQHPQQQVLGAAQHPQTPYYHQPSQQAPVQHTRRGPIWYGLAALIAGVVSLICSVTPGTFTFRIIISAIGVFLALVGVILAVISLRKRWRTGLSVAGVIVSGFALLFGAGFLALGLVANNQINAAAERSNEELQDRLAEEQAAEDAILDQSQWIDDARAGIEDSDFSKVDAATLAKIMADPESYVEQGIIVTATTPEPLSHDGFNAQGLCLTGVTLTADGEAPDFSNRAAILDRGTAEDCPLVDGMLSFDNDDSLVENFSSSYRMWVVPSGLIDGPNGDDMPAFLLMRIEQ